MKIGDTIKVINVNSDLFCEIGEIIAISKETANIKIDDRQHVVYLHELEKYITPKTKVTMANVRVMISHNYSNFEVAMQLENENGIESAEVDQARKNCQSLAMDAVAEYKNINNATPAQEIERLENKIGEIKASIGKHKEITDPAEIAKVESLPLYGSSKKEKPIKIKK